MYIFVFSAAAVGNNENLFRKRSSMRACESTSMPIGCTPVSITVSCLSDVVDSFKNFGFHFVPFSLKDYHSENHTLLRRGCKHPLQKHTLFCLDTARYCLLLPMVCVDSLKAPNKCLSCQYHCCLTTDLTDTKLLTHRTSLVIHLSAST